MSTTPTPLQTFRDPAFSLWQSAVHTALLARSAKGIVQLTPGHSGLGTTADHPYMLAATEAIEQLTKSGSLGQFEPCSPGVLGTVVDCAKLFAEIAWSELFNRGQVATLKNELADSTCDPFWAECLAVYEAFVLSGEKQPYVAYADISEGVLNCLNDNSTVAIISDWGTGTNAALVLLQQIAANFKPNVLLHLGDIYYSGLPSEDADHFSALINEVWPQNPPLVFTLDGNHDRYAGASGGYYQLIAGLNPAANLPQPNSYFVLRNNYWQLLAMDTGYHDTDPYTVESNLTYLEPSEISWHLDKVQNNGSGVDTTLNPRGVRGTVMLSHHPLMSFAGLGNNQSGNPLAVNPNLANPFAPVFPLIDFWLWGHEHDLLIFQPYSMGENQPLPLGRCVGASGVPMFIPESQSPANLVVPPSESGPPAIVPGTSLGNNKTVFNHAYAVMTLNDSALTIDYYQLDSTNATPGQPPALTPLSYQDCVSIPNVVKRAIGA